MKAIRNFSRDTDAIFGMIVEINVDHDSSDGHVQLHDFGQLRKI